LYVGLSRYQYCISALSGPAA